MSQSALTVEQWKEMNAHRLIECRWGCNITSEACRLYQARTGRYILHFNGQRDPYQRINADYLRCFLPGPCPHVISDDEIRGQEATVGPVNHCLSPERRQRSRHARELDRLANPDLMLREAQWNRSLIG